MGEFQIFHKVPLLGFNMLAKYNTDGEVDWFMPDTSLWSQEPGWDTYFTLAEVKQLEPELQDFIFSGFCEFKFASQEPEQVIIND